VGAVIYSRQLFGSGRLGNWPAKLGSGIPGDFDHKPQVTAQTEPVS